MIKKISVYKAVCDSCGEQLELDNVRLWADRDELSEAINCADWTEVEKGRVYCARCRERIESDLWNEEFD